MVLFLAYMVDVKLSNWQFKQLKSAVIHGTSVTLKLSINMNGDCKSGFPNKLFLNNTQIANIRKSFANN